MKWFCAVPVLFLAVIFIISPLSCSSAVIYVKASSTHPAPDGHQWWSAFRSIKDAVNIAQPGDEIWVAEGSYAQDLFIDKCIALYGGFHGNDYEINRTFADPRHNPTVIQSAGESACIDIRKPGVIFDGFNVHSSDATGRTGIRSYNSSTISRNVVEGFQTGISLFYQTSEVFGNIVRGNGNGITCESGFQVIYCNIIAANSKHGIYCYYGSSVQVTNNTVVENGSSGGTYAGIYCPGQTAFIENNIVAFNSIGIYTTKALTWTKYNCVYENTTYNYPGGYDRTGIDGNISVDPMLAACPDDCHVQPDSPCRNKGYNPYVADDWTDIDGQQRIQPAYNGTVDIGADESDGTYYHYTARPVFGKPAGVYYVPIDVVVSCADADATIHYTTNGSEPTASDPTITSGGSVHIEQTTKLKAKAFHEGLEPSATRAVLYQITGKVETPVVSVQSGFYDKAQYVTLSCATIGANIMYTLNGNDPSTDGWVDGRYGYNGSPIRIDGSLTLKVCGMKTGWLTSDVIAVEYTFREPRTVFVDSKAQGTGHTGTSWADAYSSISNALHNSIRGDELWVAAGIYRERLSLQSGVAVYGGFAGDEVSLDQRDWDLHQTVIDGEQAGTVVTVGFYVEDAGFDGFVIRNGSAKEGGGLWCGMGSSSTVQNNIITGCTAQKGGGVFLAKSHTDFSNNLVYGCSATELGGGVYLYADSSYLSDCVIADNHAAMSGGGVYTNDFWGGIFYSCISSNSAGVSGGGVCYTGANGSNSLYDNVIWGNTADAGAAVYAQRICMIHNTIAGNTGLESSVCLYYGPAELVNNTIAFNTGGLDCRQQYSPPTIRNNCVYANTGGNYTGIADPTGTIGNISADPKLANVKSGDLHIMPGSPCIDAGVPTNALDTDIEWNPRPRDGNGDGTAAVDIGCYEAPANYTGVASAKALPDGSLVGISSQVTTAVFDDRLYVEDLSRISGIGIVGVSAETGARVTVEGVMTTIDGERVITPSLATQNGWADVPPPWFINLNGLGGGPLGLQAGVQDYRFIKDQTTGAYVRALTRYGGANNIGLMVKTCGVVTSVGEGFFYLDSGCGFDDGDDNVEGVRVLWPFAEAMPEQGSRVEVIAISSCTLKKGLVVRMLRPISVDAVKKL